ncbi:hypothetical protein [Methylobacterium nigriterrae]|uniref:hypothetical protein n=1 Tax=Methylobacterium nigriterrae TaxID=3127512 RepID=UPI003013B2AF
MSDPSRQLPANEQFNLPEEWLRTAELAALNLGMGETLHGLSPEHWQLVLVNVEARMRMRGIETPKGWQKALAQLVGRSDG